MQTTPAHTPVDTPVDSAAVRARVLEIIVRCLDCKPTSLSMNSSLWGELGAESLDMLDIVYSLERAFVIRLPRLNLFQRASNLFGAESVVVNGVITPVGLELMRRSMPEVRAEAFHPNMRIQELRQLVTVESFARIVLRCLAAKAALRCRLCGGLPAPVPDSPMELACAECGGSIDLPSGEELMMGDLVRIGGELGLTQAAARESVQGAPA